MRCCGREEPERAHLDENCIWPLQHTPQRRVATHLQQICFSYKCHRDAPCRSSWMLVESEAFSSDSRFWGSTDQCSKNTSLNPTAGNWGEIHADLKVQAGSPAGLCACSPATSVGALEPCSAVVVHFYSKADNLNMIFRKIFVSLLVYVQRKKGEPLKAALHVPSTAPFCAVVTADGISGCRRSAEDWQSVYKLTCAKRYQSHSKPTSDCGNLENIQNMPPKINSLLY